ncbi:MAG: FHIPEP family type III secretion protein [Anaeromyxobacteraceae bacterium]
MNPLHALAVRRRGSSDVALAALALAGVSALVAPVPPWLVDVGLAASLALSAAVLVVALFARDALGFASFPTLLLLTTLGRLALEIASTRLVLARGDAGAVVQAFGKIVVGGSAVVGAVVFAILTLVQILVVTKGAERVAEVAARFTLDALPGKQMAIDADLRAGALDHGEARRKRRALEREGQLYGAMDGALKFVKGDAIAGVAIVLVNLVGGLALGLSRGMTLEAAARRFALLAIGDGLAAQVPALLVSVAAGVAVTRVAAEEDGGSLSEDLARQLFGDARVLGSVAALCAAVALLPGLPVAPFLFLAAPAGVAAAWKLRRRSPAEAGRATAPRDVGSGVPPAPIVLELAHDLELLAAANGGRFAAETLPALSRALFRGLGLPPAAIDVRAAPLAPGAWRLLVDEVPASTGRAPLDEALALAPPCELAEVGIACVAATDSLTGARASLVASSDAARAASLAPVRGPLERVAACALADLRTHAHLLVGVQEVQSLLDELEPSHPALVREVTRQIPAPVLAEVLRQLLEEGVPARPLRRVLEGLLEAGGATRPVTALVEAARRALRRHIAHAFAGHRALDALVLDPAGEAELREALATGTSSAAATALVAGAAQALAAWRSEATPVVLTGADVRRAVRQALAPRYPRLAVLSFDELPPTLPVRPVGRLALAATVEVGP